MLENEIEKIECKTRFKALNSFMRAQLGDSEVCYKLVPVPCWFFDNNKDKTGKPSTHCIDVANRVIYLSDHLFTEDMMELTYNLIDRTVLLVDEFEKSIPLQESLNKSIDRRAIVVDEFEESVPLEDSLNKSIEWLFGK